MKGIQSSIKRMGGARPVMLTIVALAVVQLACGLGGASNVPTPTSFIAPTSAATAPPATDAPTLAPPTEAATAVYLGTAGEGAPLDLCALPTPDEVQAVIGGPAASAAWFAPGQNCTLFLDDTHFLIVQAGHDPDGKTLHLGGLNSQRAKITDQGALQALDQLNAQAGSLNMLQVVEQALPIWRAAGFTAEAEPGVGDWSFWFFGYGQPTVEEVQLAEFGAGRASGAWIAVYIPATDEAAAKALLKPLAAALLDRLPDDFTPTGNGY